MAMFGQYTGQRVQPLPSGFLSASMQQAKMTKDALTDIGDILGKAIAGYGRQKKEDSERAEKLGALKSHFESGDTTASVMKGIEEARAMDTHINIANKQQHDAENLQLQRPFAEKRQMELYQLNEKAAQDKAMADVLEKRVFGERLTKEGAGKLEQEAGQLRQKIEVNRRTGAATSPGHAVWLRSQEAKQPPTGLGASYDAKASAALRKSVAKEAELRLSEIEGILGTGKKGLAVGNLPAPPDLERWLTKPEALSPKKQMESVAEMHRLREGLKEKGDQQKVINDQYSRSIAGMEYKPVTPNEDRILANPDQYAQEVVTEKGQLQEEAVNRLGPKLLGKMEKGDMTKADELLVIDILSNLRAEGDAAQTPQGQLASMQLESLKKQAASKETEAKLIANSPTQPGQGRRGQVMHHAKEEMGKGKLTPEGYKSVMETAPAGVNIIEEGGQQVLMVDGQFKAIIPKAKPGMARMDTWKIPGTNKVQPVQYDENGKATPMGAAIEKSSDEIDREFKVEAFGPNAYALNKQRADTLRQQHADVGFAISSLKRLLEIADSSPAEELRPKLWGEAESLSQTMRGRLRLSLVGPGAMNAQEWVMLEKVIPDPSKILELDSRQKAALSRLEITLKDILTREANAHIEGGSENIILPDFLTADAQSGGGGLSANQDFDWMPGRKLKPRKR